MPTYEISLRLSDPEDTATRPICVSETYIRNEPGLRPEHKAAILALPPNGVWKGRAVQVRRLDQPDPS